MMRAATLWILGLLLVGCGGERPLEERRRVSEEERRTAAPSALSAPTSEQIAAARERGKVGVKLETDKGVIGLELDGAAAPMTVANFVNLVAAGFYDGMPFHRVEAGFVVQAGEPGLVGRPGVGYTIPDEGSPIKHERGAIAMARLYSAGQMVPNSGSTQFYICLGDAPHLDGMGFTAFGRVVEGMDTVDKIAMGDKILRASVLPPGEE